VYIYIRGAVYYILQLLKGRRLGYSLCSVVWWWCDMSVAWYSVVALFGWESELLLFGLGLKFRLAAS